MLWLRLRLSLLAGRIAVVHCKVWRMVEYRCVVEAFRYSPICRVVAEGASRELVIHVRIEVTARPRPFAMTFRAACLIYQCSVEAHATRVEATGDQISANQDMHDMYLIAWHSW